MEPSTYSVFADMLSKFHTSSEPIQALSLVTLMGMSWFTADVLKALIAALTRRRADPSLLDLPPVEADAQWLVSRNGELWLMRLPAPPVPAQGREAEPGAHLRDGSE